MLLFVYLLFDAYHVSHNVPLQTLIVQVNRKQLSLFLITNSNILLLLECVRYEKSRKSTTFYASGKKSQLDDV